MQVKVGCAVANGSTIVVVVCVFVHSIDAEDANLS